MAGVNENNADKAGLVPMVEIDKGIVMPQLGLGTWQLEGKACRRTIRIALDMGYRHIDTAEMYGNEEEIGQEIKGFSRERLFITSKVAPGNLGYNSVLEACEDSLLRLGTGYLDLYLIHWPNSSIDIEETLRAFKKLIDENKIRAMGVSNFTIGHLREAIPIAEKHGISISVNQVEFHPTLNQDELLEFCKKKGIEVVAYSPLARGGVSDIEKIDAVAKRYGKTPAQVSLRWLMQKDVIAIPKSSSEEHLKENLDIFDFELDEDDMETMDSLDKDNRLIAPEFSEFDKK